jgi:hypothetical protein
MEANDDIHLIQRVILTELVPSITKPRVMLWRVYAESQQLRTAIEDGHRR